VVDAIVAPLRLAVYTELPMRAGVVYAIRARKRAQIESTQIVPPRPDRTRGEPVESVLAVAVPRMLDGGVHRVCRGGARVCRWSGPGGAGRFDRGWLR
jgi:hypothetical protein